MNFKESKGIYLQIADRICDEVLLGIYNEDDRIPSVREYATLVEVNVNTMVRSYEYLQQQEALVSLCPRVHASRFCPCVVPTLWTKRPITSSSSSTCSALRRKR